MTLVDQLVLLFILLLGAVVTVPLADRLGLPAPVLMTLAGIVLALLPFVPNVNISPEYILPLVLPPLLYAAVQRTSWRQFTANWQPIVLLAVALVFVTTAAVAAVAHAIVPGLPVAAAVALGALLAPPDPVAATAVAGSLGLPRRLVSILEGEGLFNDVTAIVMYHVAITAAVTGTFSWPHAAEDLVLSAVVAIAVGVAVGWAGGRLMGVLGDATLRTGLSLLVPFVAYVLAEEFRGSGVLAVLTTALVLSETSADADDIEGRLTGATFWEIIDTLVTGVAFGLIGLELHSIVDTAPGRLGQAVGWGAVIAAVVIGVRLLYLLPASGLARLARRSMHADSDVPATTRETIVMWWAGMRGVASVALALAIPFTIHSGGPFPARADLLVIAFTVILITLVVQGLTLPWLVKRLGVTADTAAERAMERDLALRAVGAARQRLDEINEAEQLPDMVLERLTRGLAVFEARASPDLAEEERRETDAHRVELAKAARRIYGELMSAARHAILSARNEPGTDPEVVDRMLHQMDLRSLR